MSFHAEGKLALTNFHIEERLRSKYKPHIYEHNKSFVKPSLTLLYFITVFRF